MFRSFGFLSTALLLAQINYAQTLTKSFAPDTIQLGQVSTVTITLTNNTALELGNIRFTDFLPPQDFLVTQVSTTCLIANFSNATSTLGVLQTILKAGASCMVKFDVQPLHTGNVTNVTSNIFVNDISLVPGTSAVATLAVLGPPTLTKTFGGPTVAFNGNTTLNFTLVNFNPTALTGVGFTDTLPAGLLVATPSAITNTCGGTAVAIAGTSLISLSGAGLPATSICNLTVSVTGISAGLHTNTTSAVTSNGGNGLPASASITVNQPADAFQVRYVSNLAIGDSVINVTNTGASSTAAFPAQNGNMCVNVYAFSPDEQLISCCTCPVTPNGLTSFSARNDLISNTLTPGVPTSIVIKLLATAGAGNGTACNAATVGTGTNILVPGLAAWASSIHGLPVTPGTPATTYDVAETPFTTATLSAAELTRLSALCGFNQVNGSGFGVCRSCRLGGLGASKQ